MEKQANYTLCAMRATPYEKSRTPRQPSTKTNFLAFVTKPASHLHMATLRRTEKTTNAYHSARFDSCVRLRWIPYGTRTWLLRRRRHQPHPHHRRHPAVAKSYLVVDGPCLPSCEAWAIDQTTLTIYRLLDPPISDPSTPRINCRPTVLPIVRAALFTAACSTVSPRREPPEPSTPPSDSIQPPPVLPAAPPEGTGFPAPEAP